MWHSQLYRALLELYCDPLNISYKVIFASNTSVDNNHSNIYRDIQVSISRLAV